MGGYKHEIKTQVFKNTLISILNCVEWNQITLKAITCSLCGNKLILKLGNDMGAIRCLFCGATPIHIAMGEVLKANVKQLQSISIYEISAHGAFYNFLKKNNSNLTFSEFFDDVTLGSFSNSIQCQDVQNLTYQNSMFDICTSTALFEHVSDDHKAFAEIFRVVKNGGLFIFWVPLSSCASTIERAVIRQGNICFLKQPIYHDDPYIRGLNKSLVFREYGQDILQRLQSCGFCNTNIITIRSLARIKCFPQIITARKPYNEVK